MECAGKNGELMSYEIAISAGISFLSVMLIYLAVKIDTSESGITKSFALQVMFLVMGLMVGTTLMDILAKMATNNSQPAIAGILVMLYSGFLWITIFVISYFFIVFFYTMFNEMRERKLIREGWIDEEDRKKKQGR